MVIKWFPYEIPVVSTKMPENEFGEFFFFPRPKIHLSQDLEGIMYSSTLVHEILEMVNEVHDLGLTESQIRTLEVSLGQIMGQNPHLTDTVFPRQPVESSESDPGDEDDSRPVQEPRIDPRAS
jgi:hypothetical protein